MEEKFLKIEFLLVPECLKAHGMPYLVCFLRYFPDRKYGCIGTGDFIQAMINIDLGVQTIIVIIEIDAVQWDKI